MNCFPIQSFHTIALKSGNSYHIVHIFVEIFSKKRQFEINFNYKDEMVTYK